MNKCLMAMGLLLVGAAFAIPQDMTSGLEWNNYAQACCGYVVAYNMLNYEYGNFAIFNGQGCSDDGALLDEGNYLSYVMWGGDGEYGLYSHYRDYEYYCGGGGEGTPDCAAAKSTLHSQVSTDKGIFNGGQIMAYQKARQAVLDNRNHRCRTQRANVMTMMAYSLSSYRDCISDPIDHCLRRP